MAESNFDIDRLGMLSLEHFEYGVESDSSSGENAYSNSELSSNASSPPYFTDESESPLSSPTELNHSVKFWEDVSTVSLGVLQKDDNNIAYKSEEQPTCRYRRGPRRSKEPVSKRNERERKRVRLISEGFCELRKRLMIQPYNRKLPKLQILRRAILYIKSLEDMIRESDMQNASPGSSHVASRAPSSIPSPYIYDPSYISKHPQNMQTSYVDTSTVQRHDIHQRVSEPWLQGYSV